MESGLPHDMPDGANFPLVDMIFRSDSPTANRDIGNSHVELPANHDQQQQPLVVMDHTRMNDLQHSTRQHCGKTETTSAQHLHQAKREKSSTRSEETFILAKIRSIMCGLQDQRWVPTYIPFLSDRMIFELFWPLLSLPPLLAELETVPSQQSPEELMRDIKPVLESRRRNRLKSSPQKQKDVSSGNGDSVRQTFHDRTFWLCHDSISMRFDDPVAEGEYCVHQYRHRLRGAVLAFCIIVVLVINMARTSTLENSWRINHSNTAQRERADPNIAMTCSIIPVVSLAALALLFVVLSRVFHRHDTGVQQLSRESLRNCAKVQELGICIATCLLVSNIGTIIVSNWWCPQVDSEEAKILHCLSTLGYSSMTFIMMLTVPIIAFPIRFAAMLLLYVVMLSEFLLINFYLFNDDAASLVSVKQRSQSSSSVVLARIVFCAFTSCWLLFFKWTTERVERLEFAMACKLEATSLELRHLRQTLGGQITAAVPIFVARRLISGHAVRQDNAHTIILIAGMVDAVILLRSAGPADVVTLLNRIFFVLDQCMSDPKVCNANIEKMQTIGDTYTCVFGLHSQRIPYEHEMYAAVPAMRYLATNMLFLTAALAPLSVGLHVGQATGVVLGNSLTYVAVGSGIRECTLSMRRAKRRGMVTSQEFDEALSASSLADPLLNVPHVQLHQDDQRDEDSLSPTSQLGIEEMAELGKFQGLNVPLSSSESSHSTESHSIGYEMTCSVMGPCFKDTDLEAEYINGLLEITTPAHSTINPASFDLVPSCLKDVYGAAHRTVYIGAIAVTLMNIVVFLVMDAPFHPGGSHVEESLDERCGTILGLWCTGTVVAVLAHQVEKSQLLEIWFPNPSRRSWCRSGILFVILALHIGGYALLDISHFLLHNVLSDVALIEVVSLSRITINPVFAILQDVILVIIPMTTIQCKLLTDKSEGRVSSSHENVDGEMYITTGDEHEIARSWIVALSMFVILDIAFRILSDVDRRQKFATRHSLNVETKQLEVQRATMAQFVDSIVPKFASEAFQQFVIHHQSHKRRVRDFVHPWLGSWFATKVMDLPVLVVQIATPNEALTCPRAHCKIMHEQHRHDDVTADQAGALSDTGSCKKKHSFSSSVNPVAPADLEYASTQTSKIHPRIASFEDCTIEQRSFLERLQHVHAAIDQVMGMEAFRKTVCKAKSAGDVVIFTTTSVDEDLGRTANLLECAMEMMRRFSGGPCGPRVVLNSGLVVGAIIGTDRLTFELFGEAVATSLELLEAMHHQSLIVTDRVAQELLHSQRGEGASPPPLGASAVWRIRGGQGVVRVHHVALT
jgi:class 3 adenylate cyclase